MSRKPPGLYFVGLNWESYKARLMTVLTTDAWAMALAAVIAILLSHTNLTLALRVSTVSARHCACVVILSSFALGFGLWTTNFIQVLSLWAKWNMVQ
jgi:NO-binding membrane sensor protein with MHYT domain